MPQKTVFIGINDVTVAPKPYVDLFRRSDYSAAYSLQRRARPATIAPVFSQMVHAKT